MSYSSFAGNYNNPLSTKLGSGLASVHLGAQSTMSKFRNNKFVQGTSEFLYSNSLVAKVCFLVLVIIIFVIIKIHATPKTYLTHAPDVGWSVAT